MSVQAFDGAAGCGKTHSSIECLRDRVEQQPLLYHQKILALTFMHGARHKVDERLGTVQEIAAKYDAVTLDSFAWHLCRRWRSRIREMGIVAPDPSDFDNTCDLAACLLEAPDVRLWIASTYPYVFVDEAQDLDDCRLKIITELSKSCFVVIAYDEFQCLDEENRPAAISEWASLKCTPTTLTQNRRTEVADLIDAAHQIRSGEKPSESAKSFRIRVAPSGKSGPFLAAALVGHEILRAGTFALLTPSRGKYANATVELVQNRSIGKRKLGPFPIRWENEELDIEGAVQESLKSDAVLTIENVEALLNSFGKHPALILTIGSLKRVSNAKGVTKFSSAVVLESYKRNADAAKHIFHPKSGRILAMTIHQAKNREFDHVVVLWPYQVGGDSETKRRLLYNAVTRAKKSCLVLVQNGKLLDAAPFV